MIRIPQVRVVDEEGAQLGVMPTAQALAMAQERGYDLVEVAPMAQPPVARFLDFGQYKYELTKREKEAKRKQRSVTFKEVRLKPKIGGGDFDTKVRRAIEFLEDGDRIKVAVQFRGRELTHPEIGRALLERFTERIKDHGLVERMPLLEGKSMHVTVASTHKPKVHEAPQPAGDRGAASPARPVPTNGQAAEPVPATTSPAEPVTEAAAPAAQATPAERPAPPSEEVAPAPASEAPAPRAERKATTSLATKPRTRSKPAATADTPTAASTGE
jgi:translation initiation factor IF-3